MPVLPSAVVLTSLLAFSGCALAKVDWQRFPGRDAISQPTRVFETLDVGPGLRVADLGAGTGYFTERLAAAVAPDGRVWAVEVDEELVDELREKAAALPPLVDVVHGDFDDPKLPDGQVDLVLLSSVYHHIEDRVPYFANLRADLAPGGRVAILEPAAGWASLLLLLPPGHAVAVPEIRNEMEAAGYRHVASHAFLPAHSFEVFALPQP